MHSYRRRSRAAVARARKTRRAAFPFCAGLLVNAGMPAETAEIHETGSARQDQRIFWLPVCPGLSPRGRRSCDQSGDDSLPALAECGLLRLRASLGLADSVSQRWEAFSAGPELKVRVHMSGNKKPA